MKKVFIFAAIIIIVALISWVAIFYFKNLRGIAPAIGEPERNIAELVPPAGSVTVPSAQNNTDFPLEIPDGFSISIFASDIPNVRVMEFDSAGNLWVSQPSQGIVSRLNVENGTVVGREIIFKGLDNPHGLAFDPSDPQAIYIAEENKVSKANSSSPGTLQKIADLPGGGGHFTRTLLFGSDSRLYVSVGSSCNVCNEADSRRAKIFSMEKDGSDFREFSKGLRNTVFFVRSPFEGKLWGTDMGRDLLGDNIPPDEINILEEGKDYGWPNCYGKNVHDGSFDSRNSVSCAEKTPSHIDIQAHSAPLGLAFVPVDSNWPEDYKNNLLVSYHGSWNRSVPTGYKMVRYRLDGQGNPVSSAEDFISGWREGNNALGRPVDIKFKDNAMYVSDDKAGVIYKIVYES